MRGAPGGNQPGAWLGRRAIAFGVTSTYGAPPDQERAPGAAAGALSLSRPSPAGARPAPVVDEPAQSWCKRHGPVAVGSISRAAGAPHPRVGCVARASYFTSCVHVGAARGAD